MIAKGSDKEFDWYPKQIEGFDKEFSRISKGFLQDLVMTLIDFEKWFGKELYWFWQHFPRNL